MRMVCYLVLCVGGACAQPAEPDPGRDTLWLEVGGPHDSLRQALVAAGVTPAESAAVPAGPLVEPAPVPQPAETAVPADHIVVSLERGQTLIHLAKQHLGDGNRFREILAANGWTEQDARRLRAGQPVKVPVRPAAPAPR
jgi:nucleoid-associated protein YgaU